MQPTRPLRLLRRAPRPPAPTREPAPAPDPSPMPEPFLFTDTINTPAPPTLPNLLAPPTPRDALRARGEG